MNKDLLKKYDKDPNFKKEVDQNLERYLTLEQAAAYSDLSAIPQGILKHIKSRNQPVSRKFLPKLAMYMAKNFQPEPKQTYRFVFFNELCPDNYVLWNFREVFATLKLEQVAAIEEFIVVKPYFYHKAMDWMTYGTVTKFLKSKTRFIYNYEQLCKHLKVSQQALLDFVPRCIYQKDCPELYRRSLESSPLMLKGDSHKESQEPQINERMKMMKNMVVKPGEEVNLLQDYEQSEVGVPVIIKMLVFYLENNEQALQIEGVFRKSVSVDDLSDAIKNLITKNYDYLLQIKNPHLISNLIKRFFTSLKVPIIPAQEFNLLMSKKDPAEMTDCLKYVVKLLPDVNRTTLMFVINFFRQKVLPKAEINKMNSQNLSICFSPCWFRSEASSSINQLMFASKAVIFSKLMIDQFDTIFGSEKDREEIYRKSYYDLRKTFDDQLDLGLEATLKEVEQSHPGVMNSRCSSRYSQKISKDMHQELLVFTSAPFQESKISRVSERQEESEDDTLLKIMEEGEQKKENPRFSRQLSGEDESNGFLGMLETGTQEVNPRFSRNVDTQEIKIEKEENQYKDSAIFEDDDQPSRE